MSVIQWVTQQPTFNTTSYDMDPSIAVDFAGNSYVVYQTDNDGSYDIVVFKLDPFGDFLWVQKQTTPNTNLYNVGPSIAVDSSGNSYVAFATNGQVSGQTTSGSDDIVILKLDPLGISLWVQQHPTFNTNGSDCCPSIAVDSVGNSYVVYETNGTASGQTNTGSYDIVIFKLDPSGNLLWIKQQPTFNTNGADSFPSIAVDAAGNSYVAYSSSGTAPEQTYTGGFGDIVVFKLDPTGNFLWVKQQKTFNTQGFDYFMSIAVDLTGNSYVAYCTDGTVVTQTNAGPFDVVIFKLDTFGNFLWVKQQPTFNTTGEDSYPSIAVDFAGNSYVAYQSDGTVSGQTNAGGFDIVVLKLDTNGQVAGITQQPTFNTTRDDSGASIGLDPIGNPYITYATSGTVSGQTNTGFHDVVVFKLSANLCVAANTRILLADGKTKKIQDVQRGDLVIDQDGKTYKVCRLCKETIDSRSLIDLVIISPDSLGLGLPKQQLIVSPNHPIFYRGFRRPAKCLKNLDGVEMLNKVKVSDILGLDEGESSVFLYDLQFETDGSYIANGLELQSRCPYSDLSPLPKESYYDESLYRTESVWDSYNHVIPLDMNVLEK